MRDAVPILIVFDNLTEIGMKYNGNQVNNINDGIFKISEIESEFVVEWMDHVAEAFKAPRYIGFFSAFTMVKDNVQKTIRAKHSTLDNVEKIMTSVRTSVQADLNINAIFRQAAQEIGL